MKNTNDSHRLKVNISWYLLLKAKRLAKKAHSHNNQFSDVVFAYRLSDTVGSDLHFEMRNLRLLHVTHNPNLRKTYAQVLAYIAAHQK